VAFFVDLWRKKGKVEGVTFEQLPGRSGFALDFEGNKVVAVKLDHVTAREIAGEARVEGVGAGGGASYKTGTVTGWLFVTNRHNPMIYNGLDKLLDLGSKVLTNASGSQVLPSSIIVSATSSVTAKCSHCGTALSPSHVGPCPACGKVGKSVSVGLNDSLSIQG
jgi:hypothetical protein